MDGEMRQMGRRRDAFAVAGVIEALLMVALVAVIISTIQLIYIPQIMEQKEAEHMDQISNQFSSLKSYIDLQIISNSDAPMFSMLTLGSRELPYFITGEAYGEVMVIDSGSNRIVIDEDEWQSIPLTSVMYHAYNVYFVDQTYILEGGGIIIDQSNGEPVMRVDPSLVVNNASKINIYVDLPIIYGTEGKNFTYGLGKCFIRTNFSGKITYQNFTTISSNIKIYSTYPEAWYKALNSTMGTMVDLSLQPTENPTHVRIEKKTGGKEIGFYITKLPIYVQIGPGWIK
ncbi:MAG: hypothetical protein KKG04_09630 [Candidatus Thermoplasmatota archaeon]|nr:hypothetical protein [Candidatus Thermoplasmatota archaeon]